MKKVIPVLVVSVLVLGTSLLWMANSKSAMPAAEIIQFVVIISLIGFAIYFAMTRLRSVRKGEPVEDELSKKILLKASSLSYYTSLFLWVAMIYVSDHAKLDADILLGIGILGMAVTWVILVLFFRIKGLKDE